MPVQNDCRAELEGVTFIGRTDLAASKAAPGISMALSHEALQAHTKAHVQMRGEMRLAITACRLHQASVQWFRTHAACVQVAFVY
jgi:hypothetical protein